jgi:hypothetical protein
MDIQMTTEKRALTPEDPIDPVTLAQLAKIQETKQHLALILLRMESDKVELLRSAKRLDEQNRRIFEACLVDRGITPDAAYEIDGVTGKLIPLAASNPELVSQVPQPETEPKVESEPDPGPKTEG